MIDWFNQYIVKQIAWSVKTIYKMLRTNNDLFKEIKSFSFDKQSIP